MERYMHDPLTLAESFGLKETPKYRYLIYADSPLYFVVNRFNKELRTVAKITLDEDLRNQIVTMWNNQFDTAEQRLLSGK